MEGLEIAPGATKVSVWAKGGAGGELLTIVAGGTTGEYADAVDAKEMVTLTTSWAEYTIPIPSSYGPVVAAFTWATSATAGTTVSFSLDSIEWEQ